jgi:DNA-binding CsgD family transcriptional regulator
MWFAHTVLGFAALSEGDHATADAHLGPLAAALPRDGRFDPCLTRFVPNEIEALVGLGRTAEAAELLALFAAQAVALDRPWALAAAGRCRALLLSAAGDHDGAQAAVDAALVEHDRVEMPFERARTLLVAGTVQRRARRRRDARTTLEAARAAFLDVGAAAWERQAVAELGRIGGRAPASGELTESERRIVELVVAGRSNKDVAAQLYLAPATVEAALSRIYRKLGVGSRTQLAAFVRRSN